MTTTKTKLTDWLTDNGLGYDLDHNLDTPVITLTGTWLHPGVSEATFYADATIDQLRSEDDDLYLVIDGDNQKFRLQLTPKDEISGIIKEWEGTDNLEVVFDNGGGITVQCDAFVHSYDDVKQAAHDVKEILDGDDTCDWDGNHPSHHCDWDSEMLCNGSVEVMGRDELQEWLDSLDKISGYARREFMAAMIAEQVKR